MSKSNDLGLDASKLLGFAVANGIKSPFVIARGRKTVTLHWPDGAPVEAGDFKAGQVYKVDVETGLVIRPKRRRKP